MTKMRISFLLVAGLTLVSAGGIYFWYTGRQVSHVDSPASSTAGSYVALGDSVAAGEGLPTYADPSACNRTTTSYSHLLATRLNYALTNLACSGATSDVGVLKGQEVNKLGLQPQLQQLLARVERPKLITFTIGANDMQWLTTFGKCYTATCGSPAETAAIGAKLRTLGDNLKNILDQLQAHYSQGGHTPPQVIFTGYYQIFSATKQTCSEQKAIDDSELSWTHDRLVDLNHTIEQAVKGYSFAAFAPVDFTGHELCTADPWIQDFQAASAFHPTEDGHVAIEKAILKVESSHK